ncbi:uncharacterized protein K452DRAFT_313042 [Aplosporella prunicola CBS 121167]|uniref:Uncharacterized protein n=1 Tax=Aplosporella prunicola CBS 121167 TaxID=1176127 RepID=A0A6A6B0Q3_9PEZI|nr:uncharacterized protein K452DRAFT_313042 [Aplosporella prunicola CBS 121167]KAF2136607.1 hypothetical protein K452DRAFT_313042 [Aplosporella prunicola CBS 121167]
MHRSGPPYCTYHPCLHDLTVESIVPLLTLLLSQPTTALEHPILDSFPADKAPQSQEVTTSPPREWHEPQDFENLGVATLSEMDAPEPHWQQWCKEHEKFGFVVYRSAYNNISDAEWAEVRMTVLGTSMQTCGPDWRTSDALPNAPSRVWFQWVEDRAALEGKGVEFVREHFARIATVHEYYTSGPLNQSLNWPSEILQDAVLLVDEAALASIQAAIRDPELDREAWLWAIDPGFGMQDSLCESDPDYCQEHEPGYEGYYKVRLERLFEGFYDMLQGQVRDFEFLDYDPFEYRERSGCWGDEEVV